MCKSFQLNFIKSIFLKCSFALFLSFYSQIYYMFEIFFCIIFFSHKYLIGVQRKSSMSRFWDYLILFSLYFLNSIISSVLFSSSVMSNSLQSHEPQHARPPCPSPTTRVHPNPCPLSQWCHLTISSSVIPFSSCPQSFPASGSFQMSQLSTSGGQSIRVSVSTSVFPMNTQDWYLGWTPCRPRDSQEPFPTPQFKSINSSALGFLYSSTLTSIHDHWKNHSLD